MSCRHVVDIVSRVRNVCCTCLHCLHSLHDVWMDDCLGLLEFLCKPMQIWSNLPDTPDTNMRTALGPRYREGAAFVCAMPSLLKGHRGVVHSHLPWAATSIWGHHSTSGSRRWMVAGPVTSMFRYVRSRRASLNLSWVHPENAFKCCPYIPVPSGEKTSLILWHLMAFANAEWNNVKYYIFLCPLYTYSQKVASWELRPLLSRWYI